MLLISITLAKKMMIWACDGGDGVCGCEAVYDNADVDHEDESVAHDYYHDDVVDAYDDTGACILGPPQCPFKPNHV